MRHHRAWTLIELLVVIAILALLIGLLMPALGAAREQARVVQCLSRQRTVGQGVMLYIEDNRGHFPLSSHTTGNAFSLGNWVRTLEPLGVPQSARRCPSDPANRPTSFATNDYLEPLPAGGGHVRIELIPSPTATAFAVEVQPSYPIDHLHAVSSNWTTPAQVLGTLDTTRHADRTNLLYLDGHAAALPRQDIETGFTAASNFLNPDATP